MLVLIRHGEATANAARLLLGRTDAPLTDRGRQQVLGLRSRLRPAERVISSPLRRTVETAELLGLVPPIEIDQRWIERDYGDEEGTPLAGAEDIARTKWYDTSYRPPGGETLLEVSARVAEACAEFFADDGKGARASGTDLVVVSHVSPIKAAVAWALGVSDSVVWRLHLSTASVTRIRWSAGGPQLTTYNWTEWAP